MSSISNALSGQPDDISSILAQLNMLLTPTEKLPTGGPGVSILAPTAMTGGSHGGGIALPSVGSPGSQGSSMSSLLTQAANPNSLIGKALRGIMGGGNLSAADTASLASGAAADSTAATSAVSSALGNVANDGTAASVQAANDAALSGIDGGAAGAAAGLGSNAADLGLTGYGTAGAADAISQLGNVTDDGTAAAVQASNDAALSATDGGAAGAASGAASASPALQGLGALGAAYSLYNTGKNWQSGNTGSDALNGAESGASIGTMIVPGIGTVIGGLIGGAAGALSSAFGGGEKDPETTNWNNLVSQAQSNPSIISSLSPSQAYQSLAGIMDAKNNTPGHSTALEQHFGRMGEGTLMDQMANEVNQAVKANPSLEKDSASQMYSGIVEPWLKQQGAYVPSNAIVSSNGAQAGSSVDNLLTGLLGDWMNGSINANSQLGVSGQTIGGLANYIGLTPQEIAAMQGPKVSPFQQTGLGQLKGLA